LTVCLNFGANSFGAYSTELLIWISILLANLYQHSITNQLITDLLLALLAYPTLILLNLILSQFFRNIIVLCIAIIEFVEGLGNMNRDIAVDSELVAFQADEIGFDIVSWNGIC
jgi:hypothetical protein